MSRTSFLSAPFLLDFEALEQRVDRLNRSSDGDPPNNIERVRDADGWERFLVTIAVAGLALRDLAVVAEDGQLIVWGRRSGDRGSSFLHRGIAARQFRRSFLLADGVDVTDASLWNGLLTISVALPRPTKAVRRVDIRSA